MYNKAPQSYGGGEYEKLNGLISFMVIELSITQSKLDSTS